MKHFQIVVNNNFSWYFLQAVYFNRKDAEKDAKLLEKYSSNETTFTIVEFD